VAREEDEEGLAAVMWCGRRWKRPKTLCSKNPMEV